VSTSAPRLSPFVDERPDWPLNVAVYVALGVALVALGSLLRDQWWWFVGMGVALLVTTAIVVTRLVLKNRHRAWATLAGLLILLFALCLFFAPTSSILGIIPTFDTIDYFDYLLSMGNGSIARQKIPANPVTGILFIIAFAVGIVAIMLDFLAIVMRKPAATGFIYLGLVAVPTFIAPDLADPFLFVLAGAAWLVVVHLSSPYVQGKRALAVGGVSLIAAVIVQLVVLPVTPFDERTSDVELGYTTGLNPILTLGDSLRQNEPVPALRYTSDAAEPGYLTFSILESFDDEGWQPRPYVSSSPTDLGEIDPAPGRTDDVAVEPVTTSIRVGAVGGRWLPVPYSPTSIDGVVGNWVWQRTDRGIRSTNSSMQGQAYTVLSDVAHPTVQQLLAAGTEVPPSRQEYTLLPSGFPDEIVLQAEQIAGDLETNYEKAIALQQYFHGSEFQYSTDAPVSGDFDGTDADIIKEFLDVKSGYCVHYASAMAVMARSLGIPARVSVGFTPGRLVLSDDGDPSYLVTTDNLHAWPELYFLGVGWVRFEPTPGQGEIPTFDPGEAAPEPSPTDTANPTNAPEPTPTADPSTAPTPTETPGASVAPIDESPAVIQQRDGWRALTITSLLALVLLLALSPAIVRAIRRRRRFAAVYRSGDASAAWTEVSATAVDLGHPVDETVTPRELEDLLGGGVALTALREAFELDVFGAGGARASLPELRDALRGVRDRSSRGERARAVFAPRSELRKWLRR
jgi:transglutaminase-like putative cysteine protease